MWFSMLSIVQQISWFLINLLPPPHHSIRILWQLDLSRPRIGAFYEFHGNSPKSKKWGRRNCCLENTEIWWVQAISWWKAKGVELRRSDMLILLTVVRLHLFCSHCCQAPEVSLTIVSAFVWAWLKFTVFSDMFKAGRCGKIIGSGRGRGQGRAKMVLRDVEIISAQLNAIQNIFKLPSGNW